MEREQSSLFSLESSVPRVLLNPTSFSSIQEVLQSHSHTLHMLSPGKKAAGESGGCALTCEVALAPQTS